MLRAILLYLSKASWARRVVIGWRFSRRAAARFVAGDTLDEAIPVVHGLNQAGLLTTLDHLGEGVSDAGQAMRATDDYINLIERMHQSDCRSNASLKLTQLGLNIDYELCLSNLRCIARRAIEFETFVRIDMEDSPTVENALAVYRALHQEGLGNIGLVFQSYLYRSLEDCRATLELGARIRLVKGAYKEPAQVAYQRKSEVDSNFDRMTELVLDHAASTGCEPGTENGRFPPVAAIATHDEARIEHAIRHAAQIGMPKAAVEFQMLYGIRGDLQRDLSAQGYPVRVYVPYGTEWYPYFMRRLAERPANLWFFLSNLLRG